MSINILDQSYTPTIKEMGDYITGESSSLWSTFTSYIEETYNAKPQIAYSVCSGQPGWNLKYKKSSKALCTLYPEKDFFIVLIVLGTKEREVFDITGEDYCAYIQELYDRTRLFNGTKWLMIYVKDGIIYQDVKNLLALKMKK